MTTSAAHRGPRASGDLVLRREPYDSPSATLLVAGVQEEYVVRYGGTDATRVDPDEFAPPTGAFLVGYRRVHGADVPVACGGVRRHRPGVAELKRMYVDAAHRRQGLSRLLLAALEEEATALGYPELWLETGTAQPEAVALYGSSGYSRIPPYGYYRDSPENVCFAKRLAGPGRTTEPAHPEG